MGRGRTGLGRVVEEFDVEEEEADVVGLDGRRRHGQRLPIGFAAVAEPQSLDAALVDLRPVQEVVVQRQTVRTVHLGRRRRDQLFQKKPTYQVSSVGKSTSNTLELVMEQKTAAPERQKEKRKKDLSIGSVEVDAFDAAEEDVAPVEAFAGVVDGEAVGPVQVLDDEDFGVRAVHPGALDRRLVAVLHRRHLTIEFISFFFGHFFGIFLGQFLLC